MREKYTASVDAWILKRAKRVAQASGKSMGDLIDAALLRTVVEFDEERMRSASVPPLPTEDTDERLMTTADRRRWAKGAA